MVCWIQLRRNKVRITGWGLANSEKGGIEECCILSIPSNHIIFLLSTCRFHTKNLSLWLDACFNPKPCIFFIPHLVCFLQNQPFFQKHKQEEQTLVYMKSGVCRWAGITAESIAVYLSLWVLLCLQGRRLASSMLFVYIVLYRLKAF